MDSVSKMEDYEAYYEAFKNKEADIFNVAVWYGCCQTFSITNTGEQPIQVRAANVNFGTPTLAVV